MALYLPWSLALKDESLDLVALLAKVPAETVNTLQQNIARVGMRLFWAEASPREKGLGPDAFEQLFSRLCKRAMQKKRAESLASLQSLGGQGSEGSVKVAVKTET